MSVGKAFRFLLSVFFIFGKANLAVGAVGTDKVLLRDPIHETTSEVQLANIVAGQVYLHTSVFSRPYYGIALPNGTRLPAEAMLDNAWKSALEHVFGASWRDHKDKIGKYARLPWFPLWPGTQLRGSRFGIEGAGASTLFRYTTRGERSIWVPVPSEDATSSREFLITILGKSETVGWECDKDGKWKIVPRAALDPRTEPWVAHFGTTRIGGVYQKYVSDFDHYQYFILLGRDGNRENWWRLGPETIAAKSYFNDDVDQEEYLILRSKPGPVWVWESLVPSESTSFCLVNADTHETYRYQSAQKTWRKFAAPTVSLPPMSLQPSSRGEGREIDFGLPAHERADGLFGPSEAQLRQLIREEILNSGLRRFRD